MTHAAAASHSQRNDGGGIAEGTDDVIAEIIGTDGGNAKTVFYLSNHRGDTLATYRGDSTLVAKYRFDAFGNQRTAYCVVSEPENAPRYTFSTKEYLSDAKLYLYAYRVYDPVAGRWTQRDPIDYQDSINLYQFCGNNPVNNHDNDGRSWVRSAWKMAAGAAKSAWKAVLAGESPAKVFAAACAGGRDAGLKQVGNGVGLSPVATKASVSAVGEAFKGNINQEGIGNVSRASSAEAATVALTGLCPPAGAAVVATKEFYDLTMDQ